jgi:hypothetical protein
MLRSESPRWPELPEGATLHVQWLKGGKCYSASFPASDAGVVEASDVFDGLTAIGRPAEVRVTYPGIQHFELEVNSLWKLAIPECYRG